MTSGIGLKKYARASGPRTTTTTRSWRKPSPTVWRKPLPSACINACAMNGATDARKRSPARIDSRKYRGIRPAAGYPACPDHTEKGTLWRLLDVQANTGMLITESFAMWPGSSVSGLWTLPIRNRAISVLRENSTAIRSADYCKRKGMSVGEVERWLGQNLNDDPAKQHRVSLPRAGPRRKRRARGDIGTLPSDVSMKRRLESRNWGGPAHKFWGGRPWLDSDIPGFAYLHRRRSKRNPGELLLTAVAQDRLEARLFEALPWLVLKYWEMDIGWLVQGRPRATICAESPGICGVASQKPW